jgi:hypothetical protein
MLESLDEKSAFLGAFDDPIAWIAIILPDHVD